MEIDPDAARFRSYAEGHTNDSPLDLSGREGYDPRSDGPHEPCPICQSRGHDASDCDE